MIGIRDWLKGIGLGGYADLFEGEQIDFDTVRHLDDASLKELGVPMGPRLKLLAAIRALSDSHHRFTNQPQPPSTPEAALKSPGRVERRQLTVMFCDLIGSTELAEQLDPEELRELMRAYQSACATAVERYDGHVAQYLGDGLMVYFGWPKAHEDDAVRAIRAGLELAQAVSELKGSTPLRARVGIHTGLVVVGETGHGDASVPKAAVGETPNIAARLQSLAEPSSVVVSERARSLAAGLFEFTELGVHSLKGMSECISLARVVGTRSTNSRFEASRGEVGLTPVVGREEELALLLHRWQQAKESEGQVVLVGGEPGIGKSRLARVLRERLGQQGYTLLRYQC